MPRRDLNIELPNPAHYRIFCLSSRESEMYWPRIAPHLERFCRETAIGDLESLYRDLQDARKQCWGMAEGSRISLICLTSIENSICWIWACVGKEELMGQFEEGLAQITSWAHSIGCKALRVRGRKGWQRRLRDFKTLEIILEKEI